jgi:hypothetical protein
MQIFDRFFMGVPLQKPSLLKMAAGTPLLPFLLSFQGAVHPNDCRRMANRGVED